jgi:hypothetical protein
MTDPRRPDETEEFAAVDEAADATAEEELDADDELDAEGELEADVDLDADEDTDVDELETKELPRAAAGIPAGAATGVKPTASRDRQVRTPTQVAPVDELPYVDDRVSKIWVVLIAVVFAAIFIYGLLLGRGGILTTSPTPEPSPSRPPSAPPSVILSPTVRPSVTAAPSRSASPSASGLPSRAPSPTSSASPVAGPT